MESIESNSKSHSRLQNYILLHQVGKKGNFSEVWKALQKKTKTICAVKIIDNEQIKKHPKVLELLQSEINVLKSIKNENVVRLYEHFFEQNHYYLVMEYCEGGDLEDYLKSHGKSISESEALMFFKQMLNGFQALHKERVMPRDFKLANVLIHEGVLKIADLGFSKQADAAYTALGTAVYMAPEVMQFKKYSNKIDIYSLGVCLYEMVMGMVPFKDNLETKLLTKVLINNINWNVKGKETTPEFRDLVKSMLNPDPIKRINWVDLYKHPILNPKQKKEEPHKPQSKKELEIIAQEQIFNSNKGFYDNESNLDFDNEDTLNLLLDKINKKIAEGKQEKQSSGESSGEENKKGQIKKNEEVNKKKEVKPQEEEIKANIEQELAEKNKSMLILENKYLHMKNLISFHAKVLNDGYKLIRNKNGIYIYFSLSKRILFLAKQFSNSLEKKQNLFEDLNFESFSKLWSFEKIASVFKDEKGIYENYFDSLLVDIKSYETHENPLYSSLKGEFQKNWENVNELLFKQILLDYCLSGQEWIDAYIKEKKLENAIKLTKHLIELIDCYKYQESFQFNSNEEGGFNFEVYMKNLESLSFKDLNDKLNEKINKLF